MSPGGMNRSEWKQLPYREDTDSPIRGHFYRAKGDTSSVFEFTGTDHFPKWECWSAPIR